MRIGWKSWKSDVEHLSSTNICLLSTGNISAKTHVSAALMLGKRETDTHSGGLASGSNQKGQTIVHTWHLVLISSSTIDSSIFQPSP